MLAAYDRQNQKALYPLPPSTDIPAWTAFLGLGSLSPLTQSRLNAYLSNPGTSDEATKQNSILFLLVSSPDWQVI
jgi:pyruvate dehydrogenase complex dehydrogenase (E1) component